MPCARSPHRPLFLPPYSNDHISFLVAPMLPIIVDPSLSAKNHLSIDAPPVSTVPCGSHADTFLFDPPTCFFFYWSELQNSFDQSRLTNRNSVFRTHPEWSHVGQTQNTEKSQTNCDCLACQLCQYHAKKAPCEQSTKEACDQLSPVTNIISDQTENAHYKENFHATQTNHADRESIFFLFPRPPGTDARQCYPSEYHECSQSSHLSDWICFTSP